MGAAAPPKLKPAGFTAVDEAPPNGLAEGCGAVLGPPNTGVLVPLAGAEADPNTPAAEVDPVRNESIA